METRKDYIDYLVAAIQTLHIKEPKNGLENWLMQIEGQLRGKHSRQLDMTKIMHEFANAFYTGIVEGSLKKDPKYDNLFDLLCVDDVFMGKIFAAMTTRGNRSSAGLEFKFPEHICSDQTLVSLAKALRHPDFPHDIVIDLSRSSMKKSDTKFSDAGVDELLKVLDDDCAVSVKIVFDNSRGFCSPHKLQELDARLAACKERYDHSHKKVIHKKPALKAKTSGHKKLEEPDLKPKKAAKGKAVKKPGLFSRLSKHKKNDDKKKKATRHSPRGSRESE